MSRTTFKRGKIYEYQVIYIKNIVSMIVWSCESDINGIISNISELSIDSIKINALNMNGLERGIAEIFLHQINPSIHTQRAYDTLMSYCGYQQCSSALWELASLMARDVNDDIKLQSMLVLHS